VIVLDTNVLLYAVGSEHPLRPPSRDLFETVASGEVAATTMPEVIQEFTHGYGRRRPRSQAALHARRFAALLEPLVETTSGVVAAALDLYESHQQLDAFDAFLAAAAIATGARALVSADRAFAAVDGLRFVELGSQEFDRLIA
jgi:uncharacterized protein